MAAHVRPLFWPDFPPRTSFAPILYVTRYSELGEDIRLHNAVGAGLSSSVFTLDVREAERFVSTTSFLSRL